MEYYTGKEVKKMLRISDTTLMRYRNEGMIKFRRISDKKILYEKDSVNCFLNGESIENKQNQENKMNVIYCRVSTSKQKDDLKKQEQLLKDYCNINGFIVDKVYSEIASGMNEDRKELNNLLETVSQGKINKIFITYKDRLTRFGYGYIENICKIFDVDIVVLNNTVNQESFEQELSNDLISIIHHFSMKLYGKRRSELSKIKKQLEEGE